MNKKLPVIVLTMALAATPLMACSNQSGPSSNVEDVSAGIIPVQFEIYLEGFMRDSSPIIVTPYDAQGNPLDPLTIEQTQVEDNRVTVYMQNAVDHVKLIAPINPDGSTYEIDDAESLKIEKDGTNAITGKLVNIHGVTDTVEDKSGDEDNATAQEDNATNENDPKTKE
jgi:hypothetical protein